MAFTRGSDIVPPPSEARHTGSGKGSLWKGPASLIDRMAVLTTGLKSLQSGAFGFGRDGRVFGALAGGIAVG